MSTTTEMRPVSVFALNNIDSLLHVNLLGKGTPLLDAEGESIGQELARQFGDRIKFLCHMGPGAVHGELEHPELLNGTESFTQFDSFEQTLLQWPPLFYALVLLRQSLLEYVSGIPFLSHDDLPLAQQLAAELVEFCSAEVQTYLARIPLAGVDVDEPVCANDCTLRKFSGEELGHIASERHQPWTTTRVSRSLPVTRHPSMFLFERVVLELRQPHSKTRFYDSGARCQKVLLALHLMGIEYSGAGFGAMLQEPLWLHQSGRSMYPLLMPNLPARSITIIDTAKLNETVELANHIPDEAVQGPASSAGLVLRRVCLGMSKQDPGDAVIDYTVALEALLLRSSDVTEARRRFALHGAVYTARTAAARKRAYGDLTDIYSARSILVHGVDPNERRARNLPVRLSSIRSRAAELSRLAIRRALTSGWPSEQDFTDALLDDAPGLDEQLP